VRIFLSYRRGDVGGYAGRLADALRLRLGSKSVFQDVATISPGQEFTTVIERALSQSDALLAVIGPGWLSASTPDGARRLFEPHDYVRLELGTALNRDLRVVPVLVGGAALPAAADLPDALQGLAQRQAVVLHDETWHHDIDGLLRSLRGEPAVPTKHRPRWALAAAAAIAVAVFGGGAWWLWGSGSGGGPSTGSDVAGCPSLAGWSTIPLNKNATGELTDTSGSLSFNVEHAYWRVHGAAWQVMLHTTVYNATPDAVDHGPWRYQYLTVAQRPFSPTCFTPNPYVVRSATRGDAFVGFDVSCQPVGRIQLRIDSDTGPLIDVTPNTLQPGNC
jgi:hypothetical protein